MVEENTQVQTPVTPAVEQLSNEPIPAPSNVENEDKLKEHLSVIGEVRKELANAYKENKETKKSIEMLNKEIEQLRDVYNTAKSTIEQLNKSLDVYRTREEEAAQVAYNKRLEQLSKDFGELGQNKTVEQLRILPKEVISEFESIVGVARNKKSQEQLSDPVTIPTQSMPQKVKPVPVQHPKTAETLSNKDFLTGICDTLVNQQSNSGKRASRTLII